jgi:hypothetical protein
VRFDNGAFTFTGGQVQNLEDNIRKEGGSIGSSINFIADVAATGQELTLTLKGDGLPPGTTENSASVFFNIEDLPARRIQVDPEVLYYDSDNTFEIKVYDGGVLKSSGVIIDINKYSAADGTWSKYLEDLSPNPNPNSPDKGILRVSIPDSPSPSHQIELGDIICFKAEAGSFTDELCLTATSSIPPPQEQDRFGCLTFTPEEEIDFIHGGSDSFTIKNECTENLELYLDTAVNVADITVTPSSVFTLAVDEEQTVTVSSAQYPGQYGVLVHVAYPGELLRPFKEFTVIVNSKAVDDFEIRDTEYEFTAGNDVVNGLIINNNQKFVSDLEYPQFVLEHVEKVAIRGTPPAGAAAAVPETGYFDVKPEGEDCTIDPQRYYIFDGTDYLDSDCTQMRNGCVKLERQGDDYSCVLYKKDCLNWDPLYGCLNDEFDEPVCLANAHWHNCKAWSGWFCHKHKIFLNLDKIPDDEPVVSIDGVEFTKDEVINAPNVLFATPAGFVRSDGSFEDSYCQLDSGEALEFELDTDLDFAGDSHINFVDFYMTDEHSVHEGLVLGATHNILVKTERTAEYFSITKDVYNSEVEWPDGPRCGYYTDWPLIDPDGKVLTACVDGPRGDTAGSIPDTNLCRVLFTKDITPCVNTLVNDHNFEEDTATSICNAPELSCIDTLTTLGLSLTDATSACGSAYNEKKKEYCDSQPVWQGLLNLCPNDIFNYYDENCGKLKFRPNFDPNEDLVPAQGFTDFAITVEDTVTGEIWPKFQPYYVNKPINGVKLEIGGSKPTDIYGLKLNYAQEDSDWGDTLNFTLHSDNFKGRRYGLITVRDYTTDVQTPDVPEGQAFHVRIKGPDEGICFSPLDKEGVTGAGARPRLKFDWDWDAINFNPTTGGSCDFGTSNYIYCDAAQFTIGLVKRLHAIRNGLKSSTPQNIEHLLNFEVYLIQDGFSEDFQEDFHDYYKSAAFVDTYYDIEDEPLSAIVSDPDRLIFTSFDASSANPREKVTPIDGPGLYRVDIELIYDDVLNKTFYNNNRVNVTVNVYLEKQADSVFDSPLYRMPFDGALGFNSSTGKYEREGYGRAINLTTAETVYLVREGDTIITVNESEPYSDDYLGELPALDVITNNDFVLINQVTRGDVLRIENDILTLSYSNASPILAMVEKRADGNADFMFYLTEDDDVFDSGEDYMTIWKGCASSLGTTKECLDFADNFLALRIKDVGADALGDGMHCDLSGVDDTGAFGLSWYGKDDRGEEGDKVFFRTVFYTPKDKEFEFWAACEDLSSVTDTPYFVNADGTEINQYSQIPLALDYSEQKIDPALDLDNINILFDLIEQEELCINNSADSVEIWWNEDELLQELDLGFVSDLGLETECEKERYTPGE